MSNNLSNNLSGAFKRKDTALAQLPENKLALNALFFREVVRRIETIVPTQDPDSNFIQVKKPKDASSPGLIIKASFTTVTLTACSNGQPYELTILSPNTAVT